MSSCLPWVTSFTPKCPKVIHFQVLMAPVSKSPIKVSISLFSLFYPDRGTRPLTHNGNLKTLAPSLPVPPSLRHLGLQCPFIKQKHQPCCMRFPWSLSVCVFWFLYFIFREGSYFNSFVFSNTISGLALSENRSYLRPQNEQD